MMKMPINDPFDLAALIEPHERSFYRTGNSRTGKNYAAIGHQVRVLYLIYSFTNKLVDCIDWRYPFIDLFVDLQIVKVCRRHIVSVAIGGNQYKRGTRIVVGIWLERV